MKITYIYFNKITKNSANMNQTLNMVSSLSEIYKITFVSGWFTGREIREVKEHFSISNNFFIKKMPISLNTNNLILEKITRIIYCFFSLIYLKFSKSDLIYTRDFGFLFFLSKLPSILKPSQTIFFEMHTIYHLTSKKVKYNQEKMALSQADTILAISKGIKDDLLKIFNLPESKIFILPDGFNKDNFDKVLVEEKSDHFINIIYAGTFKDWKGVDTLIKSLKYIKYENIRIELIGGVGKDRKRIEELIKKENLKIMIIVEGFLPQNEVIKRLKLSDIAIIPNIKTTIGEKYTSPLKLFEYMACGLPIISSDLPSMREILKEDRNALFFEANNEKDLGFKIDKLIIETELLKNMSINNINDSKNYSWDKRAEKISGLIKY
jgi:glycosyltransferase involved in cell wall biosynthesis